MDIMSILECVASLSNQQRDESVDFTKIRSGGCLTVAP